MDRLIAIVALLFCVSSCTEDTWSWLCPAGAIRVDGQCEWTYSQIAAGGNQNCGVRAVTGEVVCWGQALGIQGWPTDVAFTQVSTGWDRTCGIVRGTGELRCWSGEAALVDFSGLGSYTQVVVAGAFVCAIRSEDSTLRCWHSEDVTRVRAYPSDVAFSQIAVGRDGWCGIRKDDSQLQCWDTLSELTPPEGEFCSLSGGGIGLCALRCNGEPVCFKDETLVGEVIPRDMRFTELKVGLDQICGISADDGYVSCWTKWEPPAAQPPRIALEQLVLGGSQGSVHRSAFFGYIDHACALRRDDHRIVCWGDDYTGQVTGAPSFTRFSQIASRTVPVGGHEPPETLVCGIRERDARVTCWGDDERRPAPDREYTRITTECGILAADGRTDCLAELAPDEPLSEVQVSPDGLTACGLRAADHTAICWHRSDPDRNGDSRVMTAPANVALHNLVMGFYHACALRDSDNHVICWGEDTGGAISEAPGDVAFRQLEADQSLHISATWPDTLNTCGIRESDGRMQCWGAIDEYAATRQPPTVQLYELAANTKLGILEDTREIASFFDDGSIQIESQQGIRFRAVADSVTCGIREDDRRLTCWGKVIWNP